MTRRAAIAVAVAGGLAVAGLLADSLAAACGRPLLPRRTVVVWGE